MCDMYTLFIVHPDANTYMYQMLIPIPTDIFDADTYTKTDDNYKYLYKREILIVRNEIALKPNIQPLFWWISRHYELSHKSELECATSHTRYSTMGWLRLVGSLKLYVFFAENRLFYRSLLQMIHESELECATSHTRYSTMGWLRLVGSLKLQVSFAGYGLFYRSLLQHRLVILRSLLIEADPHPTHSTNESRYCAYTCFVYARMYISIHMSVHTAV